MTRQSSVAEGGDVSREKLHMKKGDGEKVGELQWQVVWWGNRNMVVRWMIDELSRYIVGMKVKER